jgi:hypothetical protein
MELVIWLAGCEEQQFVYFYLMTLSVTQALIVQRRNIGE